MKNNPCLDMNVFSPENSVTSTYLSKGFFIEVNMKKCFKCHIEKPLEEFYKHSEMLDGYLNKCKDCAKIDSIQRWNLLKNNPFFILKERNRRRGKQHHNKINKDIKKKSIANYFLKYPEKEKAKNITSRAIRDGRLIKKPCEICGEIITQAHHDDYNKPLEVRWLCIKHHNEYHKNLRDKTLFNQ